MTQKEAEILHQSAPSFAAQATILGAVAAHIAFVMELTLVPLLLPSIQSAFSLSLNELAWIFNTYSVAVTVGVFSGGLLGDRFGSVPIFITGVASFLAGSLLLGFATNPEMLILGRMMQGLGAGVFSPLIPLLLTQATPDRPGRTLILWGSLAGYIAAFAPLAYGTILDAENWAHAFFVIAGMAAVAVFAVTRPHVLNKDRNDRPEINYLAIFRAGKLWLTLGYVFLTYGAITFFIFRLPLWLTESAFDATTIGMLLSLLWLSFSTTSTVLRNKVDQHHIRTIVLAAPVLITVGALLSFTTNPVFLLAAAFLVGAGLACSNSPSTQLILRHAPTGLAAISTSLDIALARFGGIFMVACLTALEGAATMGVISLFGLLALYCGYQSCKP